MASTIEQIKNRLSIVDVVGSYLKLERAGINFKSRCPFHNEKTPSFFVSPEREGYYCFGCGRKGDIFTFVEEFEGVDFYGSLKILADRAGVSIQKIDPKLRDRNEKLYSLLNEACLFYEENLSQHKGALLYLKERGLSLKSIKDFRLGFALDNWRSLLEHLEKKGYSKKEIEEVGLIKTSEAKTYDRFRSRIIFPVNDTSGRVIAFSGRAFPKEDENTAKYLNSPETVFFKKSETLYAYDKAKLDIRKSNFAILVEGNVDVLMAHQAGYRNTVAPLGTALTKEQIEKVSKLTKRIVIAFDSDGAGFRASSRGAKIALSLGVDLKVALIPDGLDPASLISKDPNLWKSAIKESKHIIEFYLHKIKDEKDKRKLGLRIKEEILPFVKMLENKIDQAHFMKILAEEMNLPIESLYEELEKIDLKGLDVSFPKEKELEVTDRRRSLLKRLAGILFWLESLKKDHTHFQERLIEITENNEILREFEKLKNDLIFEASVLYEGVESLDKLVDEFLLRLEEDYLKERLNIKMRELREAEKKDEADLSLKILKECQELSSRINKIKNEFLK